MKKLISTLKVLFGKTKTVLVPIEVRPLAPTEQPKKSRVFSPEEVRNAQNLSYYTRAIRR